MRPEFQLLIALYAIHFAVWAPEALRLSPPTFFQQFLLVMTPLVVCYVIPAAWLGVFRVLRTGNPLSHDGPSVLPMVHLCLLVFTVLCLVSRITGIFHVT